MANKEGNTRLYPVSAMGQILKIARERACQPEHRTKQYLIDYLGLDYRVITAIEDGKKTCPLDIAIDWCRAVEDYTAETKIRNMFDLDLPATNPLLQEDPLSQLLNFRRQATQAIDAISHLMDLSIQMRPGEVMAERFETELYRYAEEILDMKQASESLLESMRMSWGLDRPRLRKSWTQEALADGVVIQSVSHYEEIKRGKFFAERAATL